jgi:glycosyltransferase involved in cell wall biosynthesis
MEAAQGGTCERAASRCRRAGTGGTPVKILYLHSSDELYGSDRSLLGLLKRLDRGRFDPQVLLPDDVRYDGLLSRELAKAGVRYRHLGLAVLRRKYLQPAGAARYGMKLVTCTAQVARIARAERVDLIHSNTSAVWGGALAAATMRIPHVWQMREIVAEPVLLRRLTAWMAARFGGEVIAVSNAVKTHLCHDLPALESKVRVVHDGVNVKDFSPARDRERVRRELGLEPNEILLGMVGRVNAWKGQQFLLQAASGILRQRKEVKLAFVGAAFPGEEYLTKELHQNARSLDVTTQVIVLGWRDDVPDVWAAIDIAVLPSLRPEPFGMSVLEAMASAKPVVAMAHGGPLEIVRDGVTGLLVPPGDKEGLAEAMARLIDDPDMRFRMGAAGRRLVEETFSEEAAAREIVSLYEQVAQRRSGL